MSGEWSVEWECVRVSVCVCAETKERGKGKEMLVKDMTTTSPIVECGGEDDDWEEEVQQLRVCTCV